PRQRPAAPDPETVPLPRILAALPTRERVRPGPSLPPRVRGLSSGIARPSPWVESISSTSMQWSSIAHLRPAALPNLVTRGDRSGGARDIPDRKVRQAPPTLAFSHVPALGWSFSTNRDAG